MQQTVTSKAKDRGKRAIFKYNVIPVLTVIIQDFISTSSLSWKTLVLHGMWLQVMVVVDNTR